ncbi:MBL fold metallo-hydrolase [Nesterenkonia sandarakina]|uniref:Glyoxylase-like metal-dependent hydrolase (Beta-lactamase superfamily II) n=1 Tax=Nesterenkonia sandarakina TaxID=272918 RepID=A0A2T0YJ81_9MICC|nr:MBL fold metallo-hydrolase [Nesterenkonia sandarakina]PRZ15099.1 glyoxylase-like metal-dependent hydrolase (beta-lactamase superfamily II) [Nesterenkonia sandarakina]
MSTSFENLVTSGTFSLDGGTWDVDNNVWIIGDEHEVIIIDPAHDADAVAKAVGERAVSAILLTHGHDDHISQALEVQKRLGGRIHLNPEDQMLWDSVHEGTVPDVHIGDGDVFTVGDATLVAIHTPGHSPGSTCFYSEALASPDGTTRPVLFSGDTLFSGGPGATGRSYSSFETIIESIRTRLFQELPAETVVNTGHGPSTSIGTESPQLQEWIDRGE